MIRNLVLLAILILFPCVLDAHGVHGNGIMTGFTHPILGIDHAIVIVGIGILGYLLDHSKWYLYFIPFIIAMIVGGYLGIGNEATFLIEKIIAFSVLLTGLFIIYHKKINTIFILISIAIFGFFHGYAHGAEMPQAMDRLVYISGFSLGSLLMATVGMFIGSVADREISSERNIYFVGGIIIGCGLVIVMS